MSGSTQGFVPVGSETLAASTVSSNIAFPSEGSALTVMVTNFGLVQVNVQFGDATVAVTPTTGFPIQSGQTVAYPQGLNTYIAAVTASGVCNLLIQSGTGVPNIVYGVGLAATVPQVLYGIAGTWTAEQTFNGGIAVGDAAHFAGLVTLSGAGPRFVGTTTVTQPLAEVEGESFVTMVVLSANNSQDVLGNVSRMWIKGQGHHYTAEHTSAYYGENTPFATVGGGIVERAPAFVGISGNQGLDDVKIAIDFEGHPDVNNGGGFLRKHYYGYQEPSTAAEQEFSFYLSAPMGIGTDLPTYNIDIDTAAGGNISATNWLRIGGGGAGEFIVTSTGASFYPGYNPGAGGLGVTDLVVGNNGTADPTNATTHMLYISSCAGTPTGVPAQAAVGRIALRYDTTADKLWRYNSGWKSVAFT